MTFEYYHMLLSVYECVGLCTLHVYKFACVRYKLDENNYVYVCFCDYRQVYIQYDL